MSLMDAARQEAAAAGGAVKPAEGTGAVKKSHGAEYQRKQKQIRYQDGLAFEAYLTKIGKIAEVKADAVLGPALIRFTKKPGSGQSFGGLQTPLIYRLFGDSPKVGQKVSALTVYQKTRKGYNEFKQQVKKWLDKNVAKCHYDEETNADDPVWVIDAIMNLPPKAVPAAEV
jgi:hypothetical protein